MSDYRIVTGRRKQLEERIAVLEAETDNLKAIMLGEGGTEKVNLEQRYHSHKVSNSDTLRQHSKENESNG